MKGTFPPDLACPVRSFCSQCRRSLLLGPEDADGVVRQGTAQNRRSRSGWRRGRAVGDVSGAQLPMVHPNFNTPRYRRVPQLSRSVGTTQIRSGSWTTPEIQGGRRPANHSVRHRDAGVRVPIRARLCGSPHEQRRVVADDLAGRRGASANARRSRRSGRVAVLENLLAAARSCGFNVRGVLGRRKPLPPRTRLPDIRHLLFPSYRETAAAMPLHPES